MSRYTMSNSVSVPLLQSPDARMLTISSLIRLLTDLAIIPGLCDGVSDEVPAGCVCLDTVEDWEITKEDR